MTVVADTRFLIVHTFPSTNLERDKAAELMRYCLREGLIVPTVVIVEYVKIAGIKVGKEAALTRILNFADSGAEFSALDDATAKLAGELLLKNRDKPMGDAIIAATTLKRKAVFIVTDDPDYKFFGVSTRWL
jgi:predicted nucleic acid-binding protein